MTKRIDTDKLIADNSFKLFDSPIIAIFKRTQSARWLTPGTPFLGVKKNTDVGDVYWISNGQFVTVPHDAIVLILGVILCSEVGTTIQHATLLCLYDGFVFITPRNFKFDGRHFESVPKL